MGPKMMVPHISMVGSEGVPGIFGDPGMYKAVLLGCRFGRLHINQTEIHHDMTSSGYDRICCARSLCVSKPRSAELLFHYAKRHIPGLGQSHFEALFTCASSAFHHTSETRQSQGAVDPLLTAAPLTIHSTKECAKPVPIKKLDPLARHFTLFPTRNESRQFGSSPMNLVIFDCIYTL